MSRSISAPSTPPRARRPGAGIGQDVIDGEPSQVLNGPAEDPLRGRVRLDHGAVRVHHHHAVGHLLEGGTARCRHRVEHVQPEEGDGVGDEGDPDREHARRQRDREVPPEDLIGEGVPRGEVCAEHQASSTAPPRRPEDEGGEDGEVEQAEHGVVAESDPAGDVDGHPDAAGVVHHRVGPHEAVEGIGEHQGHVHDRRDDEPPPRAAPGEMSVEAGVGQYERRHGTHHRQEHGGGHSVPRDAHRGIGRVGLQEGGEGPQRRERARDGEGTGTGFTPPGPGVGRQHAGQDGDPGGRTHHGAAAPDHGTSRRCRTLPLTAPAVPRAPTRGRPRPPCR